MYILEALVVPQPRASCKKVVQISLMPARGGVTVAAPLWVIIREIYAT
jgi:hypothetical protein